MKKLLMVIPLVLLLCLTFVCQKAEEPVVDVEADIEAIKALEQETMRAFNEGSLDSLMAVYAENVIWMPPGEVPIIGKEELRNWFNFELLSIEVAISVDEVQVSGDWAFVRDHWKGTVTQKESGETTEFDTKSVLILKRQLDGSWKITHAIWNSNPSKQE